MDDFFEFLIVSAVLIVAGIVLGIISYWITLKKDSANEPDQEAKALYLQELKMMRQNGQSYKDRFNFLKSKGLRKNVAEQLLAEDVRNHT